MPNAAQTRQSKLLKSAPRAIVHMRAQYLRGRLGLIFGSGASRDLKFPDWAKLVERVSEHADVNVAEMLKRFKEKGPAGAAVTRSLTTITQMLFNQFRANAIAKKSLAEPLTFLQEREIRSSWIKVLHRELYRDADAAERSRLIQKHPYLDALRPIIKKAKVTVNYNFDDTLERLLLDSREEDEANKSRGYEVIDRPNVQFQRDDSIIYHPNGFMPSTFEDGTSADVIFADDAFQDQLIHAATGKYVHLSHHLLSNTCLLIGLSLDDAILQSLLRQNAVGNPGNIHYIVHFREDKDADAELEQAIFRSNFSSFNLFTLFLDRQGIADLATLISKVESSFELDHPQDQRKFVYYVVGSVGAGKSTAASNFRSLTTYDEWIDERKPELAVPDDQVEEKLREPMDAWIREQFRKKNYALLNKKEGIHLVDRSPLDPLTFGEAKDRKTKASRLLETITDNNARKVEQGHIILLDCDVGDVQLRNSLKHKYWPPEKYEELLKSIREVYGTVRVTTICTRGREQDAVAKEIARVIFLHDYQPVDLGEALGKFSAEEAKP